MCVISPLAPKSRSSWFAGASVPLPETVDWTPPRATVTVRSCALCAAGEEMTAIATTTAATVTPPRRRVVTAGRRRERLAIAGQLAVVPELVLPAGGGAVCP